MGAFESVIAGNQTIRLAAGEQEIEAAQALRYRVFYEEMGAHPLPAMTASGRDFDAFDETCDHLVVIDQSDKNKSVVVGTYRILRDDQLGKAGEFYSANQYDVSTVSLRACKW